MVFLKQERLKSYLEVLIVPEIELEKVQPNKLIAKVIDGLLLIGSLANLIVAREHHMVPSGRKFPVINTSWRCC